MTLMTPDTRALFEPAARPREEVARFIERQFEGWSAIPEEAYKCPFEKGGCHHYGKQDIRALMDFIYGGKPKTDEQMVRGKGLRNGYRQL